MKPILSASIISLFIYFLSWIFLSATPPDNGQKGNRISYPKPLPDSTALTFLPGLVSTDSVDFTSAFSPDGHSFYFTRKIAGLTKIYVTHHNGKSWTNPVPASFSNTSYADADPAFASNGNIYFISKRPSSKADTLPDYDIWFSKPLTGGGWSAPENLQSINSTANEFYISFSKNGNLYFSSSRKGGFGEEDIYVSKWMNGKYQVPENLGAAINSSLSEYDPFIAPNENCIIFTSSNRTDTYGGADLYGATRLGDKNWSAAIHFGDNINTKSRDYCPYFSPDAKYFFYSSSGDVKWIGICTIEKALNINIRAHE